MFNLTKNPNWSKYNRYLEAIGSLSRLFSESDSPYLYYRAMETAFCNAFNARDLSRQDHAYDAIVDNVGVGLKTFLLSGSHKLEKVAEFNRFSNDLNALKGNPIQLVQNLVDYRNARLQFANNAYGVQKAIYHCVARQSNKMLLFSEDYIKINSNNISITDSNQKSIAFDDGVNEYRYLFSKSTLTKRFELPKQVSILNINILNNPFDLLLQLIDSTAAAKEPAATKAYVILPLYSTRGKTKEVPLKSGLNQWNAEGRKRNNDEVYIPVPSEIRKAHSNFFPKRYEQFNLKTPDSRILKVAICQEDGKALMSNPNEALGKWLLRTLLSLRPKELATYNTLLKANTDCVKITKHDSENYEIDFERIDAYELFLKKQAKDN